MMRVVALEEHFAAPALVRRHIPADVMARRAFGGASSQPPRGRIALDQLPDLGDGRIAMMDAAGISMQVISNSGPGADLAPGAPGIDLARALNDWLGEACARHPDRFAGFAHLPMCEPEAAALELDRCIRKLGFRGALINGTTDGRFLDAPCYDALLGVAEALDVPNYIHPWLAPDVVREAYFGGLPAGTGFMLETAGWGWHSEVAIHVLRMVLAGTLDRHPRLKLIVGHMGEGLPAMLARCDDVFAQCAGHLSRSVGRTLLDQLWITTSGMFTSPPLDLVIAVHGIDRVMFSVDHPYADSLRGRDFLRSLALSPEDMAKLCHGNVDRLLRLTPAMA